MTRDEVGRIYFDALRGHWQDHHLMPEWDESDEETKSESIAVGVAVYLAGLRAAKEIAGGRVEKWKGGGLGSTIVGRHLEATQISELIDSAIKQLSEECNE